MDFSKLATDEQIEKSVENLAKNGITAEVVDSSENAKQKVLELIPTGSEVMTMTSVTLDQTGISEAINSDDKFISLKNKLYSLDRQTQHQQMLEIGATPEYVLGSVHAVTENGELVIVSNSGSQLGAYGYGSDHVIFVVGTQKIVRDLDSAMSRIYDYVLPKESVRARVAYGVDGSNVSKLLIIKKEINPTRVTLIFVKEDLGF